MRRMQDKRQRRFFGITALGLVALAVAAPTVFGANTPAMAFNYSAVDYGRIPAGMYTSVVFVLMNTSKGSTGSLSVTLSGSSAFSVTADNCTGKKLAVNKS